MIAAVLAVAFLSARACQSSGDISPERAVELAKAEAAPFSPDKTQVRLVQQGVPVRAYWAVSLYDVDTQGRPTKFVVYLVDRKTGALRQP